MPKQSIVWVIPVLIALAGCGGVAPGIGAQEDLVGNPGGATISWDADIPDEFLIPGTDQPLALWVQSRQNLGFRNWQGVPNVTPPVIYSYEGVP